MILLLIGAASAEGFTIGDPEAILLADTFLYADIKTASTEGIYWYGTGSVSVTSPSGAGPYTLSSGSNLTANEAGTWSIQLSADQTSGFDIGVREAYDTNGNGLDYYSGRIFSDHWYIEAIDSLSKLAGDLYVAVPIPEEFERYVIYYLYFEDLAGTGFEVMANQTGGTEHPGWSIPHTGTAPASQYRIYLNAPDALLQGTPLTPSEPALTVTTDPDHCDAVLPGYSTAEVTITPDSDGGIVFVCDLESDGFNLSGGSDYARYTPAYAGTALQLTVDGTDQLGESLPAGTLSCGVVQVATPVHFLLKDASTLYPGLGLSLFNSGTVEPLAMQWNDSLLVAALSGDDVLYGTTDAPAVFSPGEGLQADWPLQTDTSAHGWGNFVDTSRGDMGWSNTWTFASASDYALQTITVLSDEDPDADSLITGAEECLLGTDPSSNDTDGDGLGDKDEVGGDVYAPTNTDGDEQIDALDEDDDNDGIDTLKEVTDTNETGVGWDVDGDGAYNWHDTNADDDALLDSEEPNDGDGDGIPGYLDPDDDGTTEHGDTGDSGTPTDTADTGRAEKTLVGTFRGGMCSCSSASLSAALWPLVVGLIAARRRGSCAASGSCATSGS